MDTNVPGLLPRRIVYIHLYVYTSSYVFLCILYFENIIFGERHFKKSIIFYLHFGHKMMNKQVYVESVFTGW